MNVTQLQQCYLALCAAPANQERISAIAAVRLALIGLVGEASQAKLVGEWNDQAAAADGAGKDLALRSLAQDGLAFAFVRAGMPVKWAARHTHLFQYMPPLQPLGHRQTLAEQMASRRASGNYAAARWSGNEWLAVAVLEGSATSIRRGASDVLSILAEWKAHAEKEVAEHEVETHQWLYDHADAMATWGGRVGLRVGYLLR